MSIKIKKATTEKTEIPTINFNGLKLAVEETGLTTFYEDKVGEFMEELIDAESHYPETITCGGDAIRIHRNGSIRINGTEYQVTDIAFNQMLSYLGVPIKFCARLSSDIFFDLVNKMFSEQYDKTFIIKMVAAQTPPLVIGFHPERKMALPTAYNLFSHLLRENDMTDRSTSFMAGVVEGLTYAMYLVFDDNERYKKQMKDTFKGPFIWPGVEILFSPVWQVKPTVTSLVIGEGFAAMNKGASFKLDLKTTGMNKVAPVIETFIRNVKTDNEGIIKMFEDSFSTKISTKVDAFIHKRLPKIINSKFVGNNFVGKNAAKVMAEISEAGVNSTLSQRRKTLFFIWEILKEL